MLGWGMWTSNIWDFRNHKALKPYNSDGNTIFFYHPSKILMYHESFKIRFSSFKEMPEVPDVRILQCGQLPHHKMGIKVFINNN